MKSLAFLLVASAVSGSFQAYAATAALTDIAPGCTLPPREGNRFVVSNTSQFMSALGNVRAGDRIILEDGVYTGNFTLSKSGLPTKPIVIRSRNLLGARINGSLMLSGSDTWAYGLRITGENTKVEMTGSRNRLLRSKIGGRRENPAADAGGIMITMMGPYQHLGCNDIGNTTGRAISTSSVKSTGARIYRNYIHDQYVTDAYKNQSTHEALQLGQTQGAGVDGATCRIALNAAVHHNLFYNWNHSKDSENETISIKSSNNSIYQNTFINTRLIMNRFGYNNVIQSNWIEQGNSWGLNGIAVKGDNTRVIGNKILPSANAGIYVQTGNQTMDSRKVHKAGDVPPNTSFSTVWDNKTDNPIARDTIVAGNESPILSVGRPAPEGNPLVGARRTVIEAHKGTIETANAYGKWSTVRKGNIERRTTYSAKTKYTFAAPAKLTTADVGPNFVAPK